MLYTVLRCRAVWLHWMYCDVLLHCPTLGAGHSVCAVLTNTTPFCAVLLQSALHWIRAVFGASSPRMVVFATLPEELQGYCARFLEPRSAGCLGQASRAAALLVREQLVAAKAAHEAALAAAPFEKSAHGGIVTYRNANDGSKLITFSGTDGGRFMCSCTPDKNGDPKECDVGRKFINVACHLASRKHWRHWRLVAFGEAQPTEAAWQAFAASSGELSLRVPRRRRSDGGL